jgi:hypothetical protein
MVQMKWYHAAWDILRILVASLSVFVLLNIDLPHGITTSFHRILPFRPEMKGQVQVVARERSLLGRVFDRLRGMADR